MRSTSTSSPRSSARTLWVSAPTEMTSTPVAAIVGDRVEGHAAARLDERAAGRRVATPSRSSSGLKLSSMIVSTPAETHRFDLVEAVDLDLEVRRVADPLPRGADRVADRDALGGEHREVVVLGEHGVGERRAMVVAAAVPHGLALEHAQAGRGLAGVDDAGARAGDRRDVARGEGRDAAHPLGEVECDALGAQHGVGRPVDAGQHGRRLRRPRHPSTTALDGRGRIDEFEDPREHVDAAEDARLARQRTSPSHEPTPAGTPQR